MSEHNKSLLRTALKIAGAYLVASGKADDSQVEAVIGGILAIVGIICSFNTHKDKNNE